MYNVQITTFEKSSGSAKFDKKIAEEILVYVFGGKQDAQALINDFINEKKYKRTGYNEECDHYWARNDGKTKYDFKIKYINASP